MSNERDRDELTERLIRGVLSRPATGRATDACLDAEVIAAWSEGGLDAVSAAGAESHLSSCATCQAVLATLVSAEPQPHGSSAPAAVPFWQRWSLRWAIPAMAGASAVLLWTLFGAPAPEDAAVDMAMAPQAASPAPAAAAAVPPAPESAPTPAAANPKSVEAQGAFRADAEARRVLPPASLSMPAPAAAASNAAPSAAPPVPSAQESVPSREETPAMQAPSADRSFALAAERAQFERASGVVLRQGSAIPTIAFEFGVTSVPGVAGGRSGAAAIGVAAAPAPTPVRWRVLSNGAVERLLAGSTTWENVTIEPAATLTAGAAPSPLVCWFVGRGGVVLRATDGRTLVRVSAPASVDLTAVVATGALEARVAAADGRTFTTVNGGMTWQ